MIVTALKQVHKPREISETNLKRKEYSRDLFGCNHAIHISLVISIVRTIQITLNIK